MQFITKILGIIKGSNAPDWVATHRHSKGGLYRFVGHATLEADRTPVVIYDDVGGTTWVRPVAEFEDGRFSPITEGS